MSGLGNTGISQWPPQDRLSAALKPYWPHRSDFSSTPDGLLLFGQRIVIPAALRLQVLDQIHTGHQGITKCRQRARQSVWWPGISAHLQAHVENCQTCARQRMQPVEPLITSAMPDLPWQKVAADFLEYDRKTYLLVVDYYSRFIEIAHLTTMMTAQTVRHMQSMFARHGFRETLVSDNGPQFSSAEFAAFATKHKIHHVTSSPLYPQANGIAERAVQTVKRLLRSSDPYDALLAYRTTPLENGYSPAELLFSRRLRTSVPITSAQRQPSLVDQHVFKTRTEDIQQRTAILSCRYGSA